MTRNNATVLTISESDIERIRDRGFTSVETASGDEYVIAREGDKNSVMEMLHQSGHVKIDIEQVTERDG
jgi:hypothetical protein